MIESVNRPYWGDDKTFERDWNRAELGFGGSGRSRESRAGMWQDPRTTHTVRDRAIQNQYRPAPKGPDGPPSPHFNTGGIVSLMI